MSISEFTRFVAIALLLAACGEQSVLTIGASQSQTEGRSDAVAPDSGPADVWSDAAEIPEDTTQTWAIAVDRDDNHACAVTRDHRVACWGDNTGGQLGDGTQNWRGTAQFVANVFNISRVVVDKLASCAIAVDGNVTCWGSIAWKFGKGQQAAWEPRLMPELGKLKALSFGAVDVSLVRLDGETLCWEPQKAMVEAQGIADGVDTALGCSGCVLRANGTLVCGDFINKNTHVIAGIFTALRADKGKAFVLRQDGHVLATSPLSVAVVDEVFTGKAIAISTDCFLDAAGQVYCADHLPSGAAKNPALGLGDVAFVPQLTGTLNVFRGPCANGPDGLLRCWGNNSNGSIGNGLKHQEFIADPALVVQP